MFVGGTKIGEICFFLFKSKQTTFMAAILKFQAGMPPF